MLISGSHAAYRDMGRHVFLSYVTLQPRRTEPDATLRWSLEEDEVKQVEVHTITTQHG